MDTINHTEEVWKEVPGWEGYYAASNKGRVRRLGPTHAYPQGGRILKGSPDSNGYPRVALCREDKASYIHIHRLVAWCFLPLDPSRPHINHIDGNKANCTPENLEWCSIAENNRHAKATGLAAKFTSAKLTEDQVREIRRQAKEGMRHEAIAQAFGISRPNVSYISSRKSWSHLV